MTKLIHENRPMPPVDNAPWVGKPMNLIRALTIIVNRRRWSR